MLRLLLFSFIIFLLAPLRPCQLLMDNMFRFLRLGNNAVKINGNVMPTPPPHEQTALTARYVVHVSDWGSLASISSQKGIYGLPYANVFSISDGILRNVSGGIPYFFMTPMDVSAQDLAQNPAATLVVSEAQSEICKKSHLDPESPVCARVMLTGHIEKLNAGEELQRARHFLFTRHPSMANWPSTHKWFFSKLNIKQIQLLDFYGGIANIPLNDYFDAKLYN